MTENKKQIRLIALDLDETTLHTDKTLSVRNRKALQTAYEAGIHIVIASGRSFSALPTEILKLPGVEYAIASNGANVYQAKTGKRLQAHYLPKEAMRLISDIARGAGVMAEGFVDGVPYTQREYVEHPTRFGASPRSVAYIQRTRRPVEDIFAFLSEQEEHLDCMNLIVGDPVQKQRLRQEVLSRVEGIYLTSSADTLLEISNARAGKASGLRFVAELLGIPREETAAFGNAENDMDMIRWAGIGVAVANAPGEVQKAADQVCPSNDEDGVGRWILQYLGEI